jgi:transposase
MITFGPAQRYFLYRESADMRKSFDGLCGLIAKGLRRDPLSGDVFVFVNRRRTHIKLLVWDRCGFVLYYN